MKKNLGLIPSSTLCVALMACSTTAPAPVASAGAPNSSGDSPADGGAPATAGSANAGAPAAGGNNSAGSSGATTSAGAGGTLGTAGTTGSGGAPAGGGGTAGMAGAAGGGTLDATAFSGGWDGALLEYPCGSKGASVDCPQDNSCVKVSGTSAPSSVIPPKLNGQTTPSTWKMGGAPGTIYDVHVLIRGVTEAYNYVGGTIDKTSGTPDTRLDLFGEDGAPQSNANGQNGSDYNSYILTVTPPSGAAKIYNLNAVPDSENPHTSQLTPHRSFKITEDKQLKIAGGSTVKLEVGDSNCVEIMNCGDQAGGSCTSPWTIPLTGSTPPIPATGSFDQPFSANGSFGQWVAFDVLDVSIAK